MVLPFVTPGIHAYPEISLSQTLQGQPQSPQTWLAPIICWVSMVCMQPCISNPVPAFCTLFALGHPGPNLSYPRQVGYHQPTPV